MKLIQIMQVQHCKDIKNYCGQKKLPNNDIMKLEEGYGANYLHWKDFRFGSDSIINMYIHHKNDYMHNLLKEVKKEIIDYDSFVEEYLRKGYTIGGEIIFPKKGGFSINSKRGINKQIKDRFDLTIECIRRYYNNEYSPLTETFNMNKDFFDLFEDFKGYIDYFLLQDIVSEDYSKVKFFIEFDNFNRNPYPLDVKEWFELYNKQMEFLSKRNKRILQYIQSI